jgi:hypothetical protein
VTPPRDLVANESPPPGCKHGPAIALDLERWSSELRSAQSTVRHNQLLAKLSLDPVAEPPAEEGHAGVGAVPVLEMLQLTALSLGTGASRDRAVFVRYSSGEGPTAVDHVRIQVLREAGASLWCRVERAFQVDQRFADRACLGVQADTPPVALRAVRLLDEDRNALEIKRQSGECGGCGRSGTHELALYVERDHELVQVFQHTLYHATYSGCPFPPVKEVTGSLRLEGGFPKTIIATTEVTCSEPDVDLPAHYREACSAERRQQRHRWTGEAYVQQ